MFAISENYRKPVAFAIALHIVIFALIFMHFNSAPSAVLAAASANNSPAIKAVAISQEEFAALEPQKPAPQPQPQPVKFAALMPAPSPQTEIKMDQVQQSVLQQTPEKPVQSKPRLVPAPPKLDTQKIAQQQLDAEMHAAVAKQQKAHALAAQKAQTEKVKQATEQMMQEQLADASKQTQIQTAKTDTQKLMQQQLDADANAEKTAQISAEGQKEVDKYKSEIIQAISQAWIIPDNVDKDLEGKLHVRLAPGGMVLNAEVTQSSGDPVLDRSARTAVLKASPLPVPEDAAEFDTFRDLNLTFQPQGVLIKS